MPEAPVTPRLCCATCGARIAPIRNSVGFTHASRIMAACDLDADHPAVPDAAALGRVPCEECGADVRWDGGAFRHADGSDSHPPRPRLPPL